MSISNFIFATRAKTQTPKKWNDSRCKLQKKTWVLKINFSVTISYLYYIIYHIISYCGRLSDRHIKLAFSTQQNKIKSFWVEITLCHWLLSTFYCFTSFVQFSFVKYDLNFNFDKKLEASVSVYIYIYIYIYI